MPIPSENVKRGLSPKAQRTQGALWLGTLCLCTGTVGVFAGLAGWVEFERNPPLAALMGLVQLTIGALFLGASGKTARYRFQSEGALEYYLPSNSFARHVVSTGRVFSLICCLCGLTLLVAKTCCWSGLLS